jgi:hypothetical protein
LAPVLVDAVRTELVHALLHFELPRDPEAARTLIRRFRREQLD